MHRLGLGSAIGLLVLGAILLQASELVFVGIAIAARGLDYASAVRVVTGDPLPLGAAQLAALTAVTSLGVWLGTPGETTWSALGVAPVRTRIVAAAAVAGLALQLPMVELTTLATRVVPAMAHPPEVDAAITALTRIDSPLRALTVPLTFVVIAPVTEELLFRGLLLRGLRTRYGATVAVVTSAVLFGAFHLDPPALLFATLMGLVLGIVAERTGSTMPTIALHAGFNAVPVLLPEELVPIPGFNTAPQDDVPIALVLTSTAVAALALASLAWMVRRAGR